MDTRLYFAYGSNINLDQMACRCPDAQVVGPVTLENYPDDEHVGIVGGRDESGNLLIIHCAYSANNVVITGADGFTSIGRPVFYSE